MGREIAKNSDPGEPVTVWALRPVPSEFPGAASSVPDTCDATKAPNFCPLPGYYS